MTLSSKYHLVLPRGARERPHLRPGMPITVLDKGGVIFLVPGRPLRAYRGIARGVTANGLREKKDGTDPGRFERLDEYLASCPNADRDISEERAVQVVSALRRTARRLGATLVTGDTDFEGLPDSVVVR